MVRLCKPRDVGLMFWQMTGPDMNLGAVQMKHLSTDQTRRCCYCLLRVLYFSNLSQGLNSWKCMGLRNMRSMLVAVVSIAEGGAWRNRENKGLLDVSCSWRRQRNLRRKPFCFCKRRSVECILLHSVPDVLARSIDHKQSSFFFKMETRFHRRGVRYRSS